MQIEKAIYVSVMEVAMGSVVWSFECCHGELELKASYRVMALVERSAFTCMNSEKKAT